MLMLAKFAFRLRPPLKSIPSRGYISPVFSQKPLARPYFWWLKARYRRDGARRSVLLGILHGGLYVGVAVYAYHQYTEIQGAETFAGRLSQILELQRICRKYRDSAFTEPAEIKAFVTEISNVDIVPTDPGFISDFCETYERFSEYVPENRKKVQERVCELHKLLVFGPSSGKLFPAIVTEVPEACQKLVLEMMVMFSKGTLKKMDIQMPGRADNRVEPYSELSL